MDCRNIQKVFSHSFVEYAAILYNLFEGKEQYPPLVYIPGVLHRFSKIQFRLNLQQRNETSPHFLFYINTALEMIR